MKDTINKVRADLVAALAVIAKKHGLKSLAPGNATFTGSSFTIKIEGIAAGGQSVEQQRYEGARASLGLPALGTQFIFKDVQYVTDGINTTGTKLMVKRVVDGKGYLMGTAAVKSLCK